MKEVCLPLGFDSGTDPGDDPSAQTGHSTLKKDNHEKANGEDGKELPISGDQNLIDDSLEEKGRDQNEHFQRKGKKQDAEKRSFDSDDSAGDIANGNGVAIVDGLEILRWVEFQDNAGEMGTHFLAG